MEIPHFGSMRGKERELIVLRSENGETWKEHQYDSKHEDLTEILNGMDEGKDFLKALASFTFVQACEHERAKATLK